MSQSTKGGLFYLNTIALLTLAAELSNAEFGLFLRLLCQHKINGSLPSDLNDLCRIAGSTPGEFADSWPAVSSQFTPGEDGFLRPTNPKLIVSRPT